MINDNDLKKARECNPKINESLKNEIYLKSLTEDEKKGKLLFTKKMILRFSLIVVLLLGLVVIGSVIFDNDDIDVPIYGDDYIKLQNERRLKYQSNNKNFEYMQVNQAYSKLSDDVREMFEKDTVIEQQNLDNVDEYFEVIVDYKLDGYTNNVIIAKKGELVYPVILDEEGNLITNQNGYYFHGWIVDGDYQNVFDKAIAINKDIKLEACWMKIEEFKADGLKCSYYVDENDCVIIIEGELYKLSEVVDGEIILKEVTSVTIPSEILGKKVVKILKNAFYNKLRNIKELTISDGIEVVETNAFVNLKEIEKLYIGNDVRSLGTIVFMYINEEVEITINEENQNFIIDNNCLIDVVNKAVLVAPGATTIPNDIEYIAPHAYDENLLIKEAILPDTVKKIGRYAFAGCENLEKVYFSKDLEEISDCVFFNCKSLEKVNLPKKLQKMGIYVFWECSGIKTITVDEENEYFYAVDNNLIEVATQTLLIGRGEMIPEGVLIIEYHAFEYANDIENIVFPEGLLEIQSFAFRNCTSLKSVYIPDTTTVITDAAFWNCTALSSVRMPKEVEYLGNGIFNNCEGLEQIDFPLGLTKVPTGMFSHCKNLKDIVLPDTIIEIGEAAFSGCSSLSFINRLEEIEVFGNSALAYTKISWFELNEKITEIPDSLFKSCINLKEVFIPKRITEIGTFAFVNCFNAIIYVENAENEMQLGYRWNEGVKTYFGVTKDDVVDIDGLVLILEDGEYTVMEYNGNSNELLIPNEYNGIKITKLGYKSFYQSNLNKVVLNDEIKVIDEYAFYDSLIEEIIIGKNVERINSGAFEYSNIKEIIIPDSVIYIGDRAFSECDNLIYAKVSNSLEKVPREMFWHCDILEYVYFGNAVKEIGDYYIGSCPNIKYLRFGANVEEYRRIILNVDSEKLEIIVLGDIRSKFKAPFLEYFDVKLFFELEEAKEEWDEDMFIYNGVTMDIYYSDEWEYVDGIPTLK